METPSRSNPSFGTGQVTLAGAVEPGREFGPLEPRIGNAPFAAHQRTEREFDPQRARAHLAALSRAAELDALQHEDRRRKQAGVDGARDVELEPGETAGAGFEFSAVLTPIDEKRPHQRRYQRQDDRDRKSEQRRLHALSLAGRAEAPGTGRRAQAAEKGLIANELSTNSYYRAITADRSCPRSRAVASLHHAPERDRNIGRIDGKSMSRPKA